MARPVRRLLDIARHGSMDLLRKVRRLPPDLTPPRSLIFVGRGDFKAIGEEFKGHFIRLGGLRPDHKVLDVGCGIGRMAIPLTGYLSPSGEYRGFDVVAEGIDWCNRRIATRFPHFGFHRSDVRNTRYNPRGGVAAERYRFIYDDGTFDFAFATSVFTHMLPGALENYLSEIARVLQPGGHCLLTYFLLDKESRDLMRRGRSALDFRFELDGCRAVDAAVPEKAVAYEQSRIAELHERCGLPILGPIHHGSWSGRKPFLSFQDILIARKLRPSTPESESAPRSAGGC